MIKRVRYLFSFISIAPIAFSLGCGGNVATSLTMSLAAGSQTLRAGSSTQLSVTSMLGPVTGGSWSVQGSPASGTISSSGLYLAPALPPPAYLAQVQYSKSGQTATITIGLLNPLPEINSVTPSTFTQGVTTSVTISGIGFMPTSTILVDGQPVPTSQSASGALTANVTPGQTASQMAFQISNVGPGSSTTDALYEKVGSSIQLTPAQLPSGAVTLTVANSSAFKAGTVVFADGVALQTTQPTSTTLQAVLNVLPWRTNPATISAVDASGNQIFSQVVPIAPTAVTYDAASRFAMQAAFGARPDVLLSIQSLGFQSWLDQQMAMPNADYGDDTDPRGSYLHDVAAGNSLLRQRIAWAFQTFIPDQMIFIQASGLPWELTLETDAFTNFKQIMLDATNSFAVAAPLGLPGNAAPTDPSLHPNQNYARELMQVFSMGPVLLNDDGSEQLDADGNTIPAYDEATILDLSRALTGWELAPPVNPVFTMYGQDWSAGFVPVESEHDHGSKTVLGVTIPAGQTTAQDRDSVINIIFQHPNVPPFISHILIQRLVKSQPSPAYIARVSAVFKNDGSGHRGNLNAVIRAILLDPEARAGDSGVQKSDDGFVQDPMFAFTSAISLLQLTSMDDQPTYQPGRLGEDYWTPGSVFSYFSPSYVVPGTTLNSPEFQLIDTMKIVQRSEALYGIVSGTWPGFNNYYDTGIYLQYRDVPSMVDAMNHMLYHGQMPSYQQDLMTQTCTSLPATRDQVRCVVFLSLNSDNFTVVQ